MLPAALRVFLVSERHDETRPRSHVHAMTGTFSTGAFGGLFQHRWGNGIGLDVGGHVLSSDEAGGVGRSDQSLDLWAKVSWMVSPAAGFSYQIRSHGLERDALGSATGVAVPERFGTRTDQQFAIFAGTAPHGLGLRGEAGLAVSSWSPDAEDPVPEQKLRQGYVAASYRRANLTVALRGTVADRRTPVGVSTRVSWEPLGGVLVAGDASWRRHDHDRTSKTAHGSVGLFLGPVGVVGEAAFREAVSAPSLAADTAIRATDLSVRAALRTRLAEGAVSLIHRDAFQPLPYPDLPAIPGLRPAGAATYLVASAQIRPLPPLTLGGWYSDPVDGPPADLQPPRHMRLQATFRSKFWGAFRSGVFDVLVQGSVESWSSGSAGIDQGGTVVALPGASFYEALVKIQLVGFTIFWNFRNALRATQDYVPGVDYPLQIQTIGVSWEFFN